MKRQFHDLRSLDGYSLEIAELGTELRVERLRRERGELVGELTISSALPGIVTIEGTVHVADFNLSSARARQERGRILTERAGVPGVDWPGLLEELCQRTLTAERHGRPAILLRDIPRPARDEDLQVDGIRFLRRHPVFVFGDGGALKTYAATYWATHLAAAGMRILYADWEFAGEDLRDRLERLTGEPMPELWYVRCERPLVAEADRLRRIVREEAIDYAILDSVAFACDGPPEAAEVAGAYFRALRRLGVGSLNIAHVTKAEGGEFKPFGSTFWHNGARSTWYVQRTGESGDRTRVSLGLFNRKANLGPLLPAFGYDVEFEDERTAFRAIDIADVEEFAAKLPLWQRVAALLAQEGLLTIGQIAERLDAKEDSVGKTVRRGEGKTFTRVPLANGIYRFGLLEQRAVA